MHFNFHLTGDESPEQTRRVANAVRALGGVTHNVGEITVDLKLDTSQAVEAIRDLADRADKASVPVNHLSKAFNELLARSVHEGTPTVEYYGEEGTLVFHRKPLPSYSEGEHCVSAACARSMEQQIAECAAKDLAEEASLAVSPPDAESFPGFPDPITLDQGRQILQAPHLSDNEVRTVLSTPHVPVPPSPVLATNVADLSARQPTTDKNGLPWDERIHSSSRAINADGTWRYRKNVPDETKQAVETELRGLVGTVRVNMDAPPGGVPGLESNVIDTVNIGAPPVVPVPPIPATAPPVPVSTVQRSYSDVVNLIMANQATLNKPELYVAVLGMSLPEFAAACIAKPELATVAFNALDEIRRS